MRKLAAIMFTDIVGYTALMSKEEQKALLLLKHNRELLKPIIRQFRGEWLKEMGDGTLSSFASAVDAVNCALEIQHILKGDPDLSLRIGIHVGDVVFEEGDVFGDGVNVASRIEPLAEPGTVCISEPVFDAIRNKPGIEATLLGEKKLKGVDHPVKVYAVTELRAPMAEQARPVLQLLGRRWLTWAGAAAVMAAVIIILSQVGLFKVDAPASGSIDSKSIAVLPFSAFSTDEEDLFFADGVHDDILSQLSKIRDLKVISRTSVVQYKNTTKTMRQIADELNVVNILEGSVRRAGNQIRIVAQLINAINDHHIWSETYDRDYADIFAIQSDVAQKIAAALKATLTPEEKDYIEEIPTNNMEAYDYFLKGKQFWNTKTTLAGNQNAADMFERAVDLDPDFTLAYTWASITHSGIYSRLAWDHTPARKDMAKSALDQARTLDPDHPQVHFAKGFYHHYCLNDFNTALIEYEIAFKGEPNNGIIAQYLGRIYVKSGNWGEKAEQILLKSYELNPLGSAPVWAMGFYYQLLRQFDKAEHYYSLAIRSNPDLAFYYSSRAFNYLEGFGDIESARSLLKEAELTVPEPEGNLTYAQFVTEIYARDFSGALSYAKEYKKYYSGSIAVGIAYYLLGEDSLAQEEFESMRVYYVNKVGEEAENASFHSNLGQVYAYLGLKEKAIAEGKKGTELRPVSKDNVDGPPHVIELAIIYILTAKHELAMDKLEYLLSIPGGLTSWSLRLDPVFDPLRDNPRFQALVEQYGGDL